MQSSPQGPNDSDVRPRRARRLRRSPSRPRFLDNFPKHEALSGAISAYEAGNYAEVRRQCEHLLLQEQDAQLRRAATELLRRIEPDRLIVVILWASFVLLGMVMIWAYGHGR
jgi:hypothetical protein